MKIFFLGVLILLFMACTPAQKAITTTPRNSSTLSIEPTYIIQGGNKVCDVLRIQNTQGLQNVNVSDSTKFDFSDVPEGINLSPVIMDEWVHLCAQSDLKAIPENFIINVKAVINGETLFLRWELKVKSQHLVNIGFGDGDFVPRGGKFCVSVATQNATLAPYVFAAVSDIAVVFTTKSKITLTLEDTKKPVCFAAPSDVFEGVYEFSARGVVGGIGMKETINVPVR
jgi:hypothetical protein